MENENTKSLKFKKKQYKIVMLGLDASGRTSTLYHLKLGRPLEVVVPTIGFNVEEIEYKGKNLTLWDVGGGCKIRVLWKHYYPGMAALLMFIDSTDVARIDEAKGHVIRCVNEIKEIDNEPIMALIASKQDLDGAKNVGELLELLNISQFLEEKEVTWSIFGCSTENRKLILDAMDWVTRMIEVKGKKPYEASK